MPKQPHIVYRVILSDESFKELIGKLSEEDYKRIYNRCYKRLRDLCVPKNKIKAHMVDEIRRELFKLLEFKSKIETDAERKEKEDFGKAENYQVHMRGFDIWGDTEQNKVDALAELERGYNDIVKRGFAKAFCPRCQSNPCVCHED